MGWRVAMQPGKRAELDLSGALAAKIEQVGKISASILAKVEHRLRQINQQFGYAKVSYRGPAKSTSRLQGMFALSDQWIARKTILQRAQALVRLQRAKGYLPPGDAVRIGPAAPGIERRCCVKKSESMAR